MNCSICDEGNIRVLADMVCTCGHAFFACDHCLIFFNVECGEPFGVKKLPPKYPISRNDRFMKSMEKVVKMEHDCALKAKDDLREFIMKYPLLEDFDPDKYEDELRKNESRFTLSKLIG